MNTGNSIRQHCFQKLQPQKRGKNEEHPILLSVPVHFPLDDWEQATQVAFERLHALGFYVLHQPLAAVYSHGLVTGLVIDIGHETTG
jgi:actin-related protein